MVVTENDNKRGEDSHGEKNLFDILKQLLLLNGDDQASEIQQNHASSSSSLSLPPINSKINSKRPRVESDKPTRAKPSTEIKLPVTVRREPEVTPEWVVDLMRKNGASVKLIIQKKLKASDLCKSKSRLLIPFNQMTEMDFLNEEESKIIEEHRIKIGKKGVDVMLVDSDGNKWKLNLRRWDMNTSSNYVLCTGWNSVCRHYDLKKDQIIRLWSFHSQDGNNLYFAFDHSTPAPEPMVQPQAEDLVQHVAQSQAPYPDQAMTPAIHAPSSSSMAPVVTRNPFICEEQNRRDYPFPKRRRTPRVCVGIVYSGP